MTNHNPFSSDCAFVKTKTSPSPPAFEGQTWLSVDLFPMSPLISFMQWNCPPSGLPPENKLSAEMAKAKAAVLLSAIIQETILGLHTLQVSSWYKNYPINRDCSEITRMKHITVLVIKSYDCLHLWWFSINGRSGIKTGQLFQSSCWWNKSQYSEAVWSTKHKISEQIVTAGGFWPSELRNGQTRRLKGIKQPRNDPLRAHISDNISSKCFHLLICQAEGNVTPSVDIISLCPC